MITGTPTQTKTSHNFVGSQEIYSSMLKEDRRDDIFRVFGNDEYSYFFKDRGRVKTTHALEFTHREDTRANERVVATATGGAANAAVTATISADYQYTFDSVAPYTASNEVDTMIPRERTVLLTPSGVKVMVVAPVDPAAGTFDIMPMTLGESVPTLTADDNLINLGVLAEEGSGYPDPISFRTSEFQGGLAIAKDTQEITDIAYGESTWIKMPDGTWTWTLENWKKVQTKVRNELEARMLVGAQITNTNLLALYPEMPTASGYIDYIEDSGYKISYSNVSGLGLVDFDKSVRKYTQLNAPMEILSFNSVDFSLKMDDLFKDHGGNTSYVTFDGEEGAALRLGFKSIERGGFTFHKKKMPIFNHPEMLGAVGHKYQGAALLSPSMGSATNHRGESVDYLCIREFADEAGKYNAGWNEKVRGGIDGMNELEEDIVKYYVKTVQGFEAFGQQHHQMFERT